jgi:hypothetical protein
MSLCEKVPLLKNESEYMGFTPLSRVLIASLVGSCAVVGVKVTSHLVPHTVRYPSKALRKILFATRLSTIILPIVLNGCETRSLMLREEEKVRVFENRVLRRYFQPKREEMTGKR